MVPEEEDNEEIQQEIEKQPLELDEMLELFRDDEEPLRPGFNPMWLVLGLIVVVGGCWLMVVGVQAFGELITRNQSDPKSAKASERMPEPARVPDVAAAFRERCAKGMTKDEIRWILEDFEKLGMAEELALDDFNAEWTSPGRDSIKRRALKLAAGEREWFADALAEGLMLDSAQKAEMKQKLAAALAESSGRFERVDEISLHLEKALSKNEETDEEGTSELRKAFEKLLELFPEVAGIDPPTLTLFYFSVAIPDMWLKSEAHAPWNLCQLSADQLAVTSYAHVSAQHGENATGGWLMDQELKGEEGQEISIPPFLNQAAGIFPLTEDQALLAGNSQVDPKDESIKAFIGLHPAQLRLALLFHPELANDLKQMLGEK